MAIIIVTVTKNKQYLKFWDSDGSDEACLVDLVKFTDELKEIIIPEDLCAQFDRLSKEEVVV